MGFILPLGKDFALDTLVHNDTAGMLGHIEDPTGLAMVGLVDETPLEGTIALRE